MLTRNQKFALAVYDKVIKVSEKYPTGKDSAEKDSNQKQRNKYGAMAQKMPILIRTAGLAQAISFLEAKSRKDSEKLNLQFEKLNLQLLKDLSDVIETEMKLGGNFAEKCRQAEMTEYLRLTQNTLAALLWFKRYSVSVLDVEENERGDENEIED